MSIKEIEGIKREIEGIKDKMDELADQIKRERDGSVDGQRMLLKTCNTLNIARRELEFKLMRN